MFNLFRKPGWEELVQVAQDAFKNGQSSQAEKILDKALDIVLKSSDPKEQLAGLKYIGLVFCAEKNYLHAQQLLEQSLEIGESHYGKGNPILLSTLADLKAVYEVQGKMDLYEKSRTKMLETEGSDGYCI